ncbi:hypothetical protein BASA81_006327 [Batrachochytrium salamandrivorans]|nr:hypothetical protein BASA81_006327 [Batrachochytrium salamandrivorans]
MDGMLLVTFFFPALAVFNFTLSIVTFLLTLFISYGPEVYRTLEATVVDLVPHLVAPNAAIQSKLVSSQHHQSSSFFWSMFVSCVTIWTTLTTYGFGGAARHGKSGWRFVQPGRGGVRYVLLQWLTWTTAALSIAMPWTTLKSFGWLALLGVVPDHEQDPASLRGLLVVGSALGILANTYCFIGLMMFGGDRGNAKFKWNLLGSSKMWWWLFLMLQSTLVVSSWQLAIMMEIQPEGVNNLVQRLLLCVVALLLAVPIGLTNSVGGKWKHGEKKFHLSMPFQGGKMFALLQALGWTSFALTMASLIAKMHSMLTYQDQDVVKLSYSLFLGVLSFVFIAGSLFWFDPKQVHRAQPLASSSSSSSSSLEDGLVESAEEDEEGEEQVFSLLGKRKSKTTGGLEYLVQWRVDTPKAVWVPEQELLGRDPKAVQRNRHLIAQPLALKVATPPPRVMAGSRSRSSSPKRRPPLGPQGDDDGDNNDDDDDEEGKEQDVWEEVEDENGNVFYYHEGKNLTRLSVPPPAYNLVVEDDGDEGDEGDEGGGKGEEEEEEE